MTTRRKFLSFLACIPGLSWMNPKLSSAEVEERDNAMLASWGLKVDQKCTQSVRWISVDHELPPWRVHKESADEYDPEAGEWNAVPKEIHVRQSIFVLICSEEGGVDVGSRTLFANGNEYWFSHGFDRKVTHWAYFPEGPYASDGQWWLDTQTGALSFKKNVQSPHEAYESALNLFLGPVNP